MASRRRRKNKKTQTHRTSVRRVSKKSELPPGHISRPVKNCTCPQCAMHRRLARRDLRDQARLARYADEERYYRVAFSPNASDAFRWALFT